MNLEVIGFPLCKELATDIVLQSLPCSYDQFVENYKNNGFDNTLPELFEMLKTFEQSGMVIHTKGKSKANKKKGKIRVVSTKPYALK
ncbi:hypothetical protein, partial [Escherichia coli]|uniref:hypothetical protein n=1 Tax=Escherichia coli TaxID=562 RepID=UPI003F4782C6